MSAQHHMQYSLCKPDLCMRLDCSFCADFQLIKFHEVFEHVFPAVFKSFAYTCVQLSFRGFKIITRTLQYFYSTKVYIKKLFDWLDCIFKVLMKGVGILYKWQNWRVFGLFVSLIYIFFK